MALNGISMVKNEAIMVLNGTSGIPISKRSFD